jgi:DNA-binding transcriptional ArsR family regulator
VPSEPPSAETVQEVAKRLRALAEPVRLRILYELRSGERSVGQLVERMGCSQPNVSRHLAQLHRAGMVTRRQEGKTVHYAIGDELVFEICDSLCGRVRTDVEQRARRLAGD